MSDLEREADRRRELGLFLRARRERLRPEDAGLVSYGRRRVQGLRREEVATLASVSPSWYTWIEQGRNVRMSADVIDAIAKALQLDYDERLHVRRLAGLPVMESAKPPELVPELVEVLDAFLPAAAHCFTGPFDLVAWNRASVLVLGDPEQMDPDTRSYALKEFAFPPEDRDEAWEETAHEIVGRLRNEAAKFPDNPRFKAVIDRLLETSEEFRAMWTSQEVRGVLGPYLTIDHPEVGSIHMHVLHLTPHSAPTLTLALHLPVDAESRARIEQLLTKDAQDALGRTPAPTRIRTRVVGSLSKTIPRTPTATSSPA